MKNDTKAPPKPEALPDYYQDLEPDERLACLAYTAHKNGSKYAEIASILDVTTFQAQQLARSGKVILHPETAAWHDGLSTKTVHALRDAGYTSKKAIIEGINSGEITNRPTKTQRVSRYGAVGATSVPGLGQRGYQSLREWLGLGPVAAPVKGRTMPSQLKQLLNQIPQHPQRQDSIRHQLADLHAFANRLGLYDAADAIKATLAASNRQESLMKSAEEAALVAVLDEDDDEAARLIAAMLPNERRTLRAAAIKLAVLAGCDPSLPDALRGTPN